MMTDAHITQFLKGEHHGKWFGKSDESETLRKRVAELSSTIAQLRLQLNELGVEPRIDLEPNAEERQLAASGKKIAAIQMYRERTGASLKEGKRHNRFSLILPPLSAHY